MDNAHSWTEGTIRVLIVDDHALVRQGLRTFLELQDHSEMPEDTSKPSVALL